MTASELAKRVRARRSGKGKWMARCPVHGRDRSPSLQITEHPDKIGIYCHAQCDTRDILTAWGLEWKDLFSCRTTNPILRVQMTLERQKEELTTQYQSARLLTFLEPARRNYWRAVERKAYGDLEQVRCRLEPVEVYREQRGRQWQAMRLNARKACLELVYYRRILPHRNPEYGVS